MSARRGDLDLTVANKSLQANAGVTIFRSKWLDGDLGVTASSPLNRFAPSARGVFRIRFW